MAWSAGPVGGPGERGLLVFLRDITEHKQLIDSLREARDAAESASRELETFSYSVAHDLRAPLRGAEGAVSAGATFHFTLTTPEQMS